MRCSRFYDASSGLYYGFKGIYNFVEIINEAIFISQEKKDGINISLMDIVEYFGIGKYKLIFDVATLTYHMYDKYPVIERALKQAIVYWDKR